MIVRSKNFELKLEEITQEKIIRVTKNDTEKKTLELINLWRKGIPAFHFKTSGSTGEPKTITIDREKIEYSTRATFQFIDVNNQIKNTLLCINPGFIGGAMVVFRALIMDLDLFITEPTSNPGPEFPSFEVFDLVSLVPLQYEAMDRQDLERFGVVLIGGAPFAGNAISGLKATNVFSTYGMTETVSHVALRKLEEPFFCTTGDTKVNLDVDGCLQFKGSITDHKWLKTNDLGSIIAEDKFKWLGRKDFVINSGGIKINPELIERKLKDQIPELFMVSSKPDNQLTEKVVLIIEGKERSAKLNYSILSKYEKPKEIIFWNEIPKTASGKIDRNTVKNSLKTTHEN